MVVPVLQVEGLQTHVFAEGKSLHAVAGLDLQIAEGETLGIVGESGCGKSMTALSIMGLLEPRIARVVGGKIRFRGRNLLVAPENDMRAIRGNEIAMIFQDPMTSLNPVLTVGDQIAEAVQLHQGLSRSAALSRAADMLDRVRIPGARRRLSDFPHQFSGGMRQRVMIAMALACSPKLLIADEPTTALDVTVQAQILALMLELKKEMGTAIMLITHDLGVVAETCDRVVVMYAGRKVEEARVTDVFDHPKHPYTKGLMASVPRLGAKRARRLPEIPGTVPALSREVPGCAFAPRCSFATGDCLRKSPALHSVGDRHLFACPIMLQEGQ